MCGRYAIFGPVSRNNREAIEFLERELEFKPTYNAAPTQPLPVYRVTKRGPELTLLRWGLVPYWAKNAAIGVKMINGRDDTLAEKPAFRDAFERRRCLVPMSGFYEWQKGGAGKVPHYIHLLNAQVFGVAGLYEYWPGKDGAAPIESYTIITTDANELVGKLHNRMPVILQERDYAAWLAPENRDTAALGALLKPFPAEEMRGYPVSLRVNSAKNDGPELIEKEIPPVPPLEKGGTDLFGGP